MYITLLAQYNPKRGILPHCRWHNTFRAGDNLLHVGNHTNLQGGTLPHYGHSPVRRCFATLLTLTCQKKFDHWIIDTYLPGSTQQQEGTLVHMHSPSNGTLPHCGQSPAQDALCHTADSHMPRVTLPHTGLSSAREIFATLWALTCQTGYFATLWTLTCPRWTFPHCRHWHAKGNLAALWTLTCQGLLCHIVDTHLPGTSLPHCGHSPANGYFATLSTHT